MEVTMYAFNDGYPLYLYLNGLKSYFASPEWSGLLFLAVSVILLIGILTFDKIKPLDYLRAYMGPILVYALFFSPTVTLKIQDEWKNQGYAVDNIPVIIAMPLSVASTMEKSLLDMVNDHIMPPGFTDFADFDFFGEAATLSAIVTGKIISNYEVIENINRYFDDCVLKGIATGFVNQRDYYTNGDLLTATFMPWQVYFTVLVKPDGTHPVLKCKDAYSYIYGSVTGEHNKTGKGSMMDQLRGILGNRHSTVAETQGVINNLARVMFPGFQSTSEQLFSQTLMVNAIQSNLAQANPQLLAAMSQAEMAQSTGIASAASVYIKKLPTLRAMFKLMIAGLAPFAAAFFLAQWGRAGFIWCAALMSVSFWMPILAIIKATYIASSIEDLQSMVALNNGFSLPNKLKIMAWISDTSTVAGTLAFGIPTTAALLMNMMAPKLAMAVGAIAMGAKSAEGFAQRTGMSALTSVEKTAKELEFDKLHREYMRAGDVEMMRRAGMNQQFADYTNQDIGNSYGQGKATEGQTVTNAVKGMGTNLNAKYDAAHEQSLGESVTKQEQVVSTATRGAALEIAKDTAEGSANENWSRLSNSTSQSEKVAMSQAHSLASNLVDRAESSNSLSSEQKANLTSQVAASIYARGEISSRDSIAGKAVSWTTGASAGIGGEIKGSGAASSSDSDTLQRGASEVKSLADSESKTNGFMQERATVHQKAQKSGEGQRYSSSNASSRNFKETLSQVSQSSSSLSAAQTAQDNYKASFSAGGGKSVNTGDLIAYASYGTLQKLAHNIIGMNHLNNSLDNGTRNIDTLRRAANADMTAITNNALNGDRRATREAKFAFSIMAESGQWNASDAAFAEKALDPYEKMSSIAGQKTTLPMQGAVSGNDFGQQNVVANELHSQGNEIKTDVETAQTSPKPIVMPLNLDNNITHEQLTPPEHVGNLSKHYEQAKNDVEQLNPNIQAGDEASQLATKTVLDIGVKPIEEKAKQLTVVNGLLQK